MRIPEGAAPDTKNKSWQIKAEVDIPKGGAEGMLLTHGGRFSGWGLYLLNGKPVFHYNLAGVARYTIAGKDKLAPGAHTIVYDFKYDGGGIGKGGVGTIQVDGKTVATGRIERTLAFRLSLDETLDCGEDTGTPVSEDYHVPFKFTGELKKVDDQPEARTVVDAGSADARGWESGRGRRDAMIGVVFFRRDDVLRRQRGRRTPGSCQTRLGVGGSSLVAGVCRSRGVGGLVHDLTHRSATGISGPQVSGLHL